MRRDLTKSVIDSLVCPVGQRKMLVFDAKLPGFAIRVSEKGSKLFLVQYSKGRKSQRIKIGRFGVMTASEARRKALELIGKIQGGGDPIQERREKQAAESLALTVLAQHAESLRKADEFTVSALMDAWVATKLKERSASYRYEAPKGVRRLLGALILAPVASITSSELQSIIDREVLRAPAQAIDARAYGRAAWNWAMKRGLVASNPFADVVIEHKVKSRDRLLSDDELQHVWLAAGAKSYPFGPLVQLLILTLQRRSEVAGMRWSELTNDFSVWTIPADRSKNRRAHVVQISPPGLEILRALRGRQETLRAGFQVKAGETFDWDLVFTTTGKTPASGIERARRSLDARTAIADTDERRSPDKKAGGSGRKESKKQSPSDWRLHDFRRTGVSKMAQLRIPPHVADRVLNHVSGAIQGVAAVYQRFEFMDERKRALEVWGDFVVANAKGEPASTNVVVISDVIDKVRKTSH